MSSLAVLLLGVLIHPPPGDGEKRYMYKEASATLRDNREVNGLFAGMAGDTVQIWRPGVIQKFGPGEILTLRLHRDVQSSRATLYGMVFGAYAGLIIGQTSSDSYGLGENGRRYAYMRQGESLPWILGGLGALTGGMLSYFVSSSSGEFEDEFDFAGTDESRSLEIERLRGRAAGRIGTRLHIRASAGDVTFSAEPGSGGVYGTPGRDHFTVLRRVAATYSVTPLVEVGVGFVDFSEPGFAGFGQFLVPWGTTEQYSRNLLWCVEGVIKPLAKALPSWISWDAGFGLGPAFIDYRALTHSYGYWAQSDSVAEIERIQSTKFGVTLFTGLTLFPDESLSLGFVVDYTAAPGVDLRAVPGLGLESRTLGNTFLGVEIGIHF